MSYYDELLNTLDSGFLGGGELDPYLNQARQAVEGVRGGWDTNDPRIQAANRMAGMNQSMANDAALGGAMGYAYKYDPEQGVQAQWNPWGYANRMGTYRLDKRHTKNLNLRRPPTTEEILFYSSSPEKLEKAVNGSAISRTRDAYEQKIRSRARGRYGV